MAGAVWDEIDLRILALLGADGRMSHAAIGGAVGLSGPAVYERVRKLEQAGALRGYRALIDPRVIGADLCAFVELALEPGEKTPQGVLAALRDLDDVLEAHQTLGPDVLLLKVAVPGAAGLADCLQRLRGIPGVAGTCTRVVAATAFERGPKVSDAAQGGAARTGRRRPRRGRAG